MSEMWYNIDATKLASGIFQYPIRKDAKCKDGFRILLPEHIFQLGFITFVLDRMVLQMDTYVWCMASFLSINIDDYSARWSDGKKDAFIFINTNI